MSTASNSKADHVNRQHLLDDQKLLRHFISWKHLQTLLNREVVTLVNKGKWDDKNDLRTLKLYEEISGNKSVLAMCLTGVRETFHHWHIYGGKKRSDKMCVVFDRKKFVAAVTKHPGIDLKEIRYLDITGVRTADIRLEDLPFVKRIQFEDEQELRILWCSKEAKKTLHAVSIPLDCIEQILFGPWILDSDYERERKGLERKLSLLEGASAITVNRSRLVESSRWTSALGKRFE